MPLDAFGNPIGSSPTPAPGPAPAAPPSAAAPQFTQPTSLTGVVAPVASGVIGAFVLGLLSLWMSFLGPWAWIRGRRLVHRFDESQGAMGGRGLAVAAQIMGMIGTLFLLIWILAIVVVIATGSSSSP